jgi:uncharacterized protein YukJ
MALKYGFVKCTVTGSIRLEHKRSKKETQYHLHANLRVPKPGGEAAQYDVAVNVGTNDADDLLRYRIALDFHHPITKTLAAAPAGDNVITDEALPALDFLRSDLLAETGRWRDSDLMDGEKDREPYQSLSRLLQRAQNGKWDVYVFGRFYTEGDGIHDVHMNQGSTGSFAHKKDDDSNDHNDVWQDGAVLVDMGDEGWAAYFTAFTQQLVPTDDLGNPTRDAQEISDTDPGSLTAG